MSNYVSKAIFVLTIFFIFSCNKKEKVNITTIRGIVYNGISHLPLKGYTVYLTYYHNTKKNNTGHKYPINTTTLTDNNGNFTFENVEINQSSDYTYELIVRNYKDESFITQQGYGPSTPIDKSNITDNYILFAAPLFKSFGIQLSPANSIYWPDSVNVEFKHQYFDSANPDGFYFSSRDSRYFHNGSSSTYFESMPMGLWRLNILKIKNGITTNTTDSVFLNFDSQTTYTLNF